MNPSTAASAWTDSCIKASAIICYFAGNKQNANIRKRHIHKQKMQGWSTRPYPAHV